MGEINDVRIFAPTEDIESWQSLFELLEAQGLIEIVQKPDKFYEVRGSEKLKRGYFKIKLLRSNSVG
ncbi:hypothetical protein CEN40_13425 [Fischerella thermalis CCMEE 5205]|nr:hypothetical protein CEN40_13425 [Fischerella thermalis CCMEE 5205]RAM47993.1 MAG: hypothetical protein C6Y22_30285 [Hapalosiphonaceae cyanobacterium JJU2]